AGQGAHLARRALDHGGAHGDLAVAGDHRATVAPHRQDGGAVPAGAGGGEIVLHGRTGGAPAAGAQVGRLRPAPVRAMSGGWSSPTTRSSAMPATWSWPRSAGP